MKKMIGLFITVLLITGCSAAETGQKVCSIESDDISLQILLDYKGDKVITEKHVQTYDFSKNENNINVEGLTNQLKKDFLDVKGVTNQVSEDKGIITRTIDIDYSKFKANDEVDSSSFMGLNRTTSQAIAAIESSNLECK